MLEILVEDHGPVDGPLITLRGDANLAEVDRLQLELRKVVSSHPRRVIIDLSAVTFMASLALGTLVEFTSGVKTRAGRVSIAGASGMLLDAIMRARLNALFVMCDTVQDAATRLRELVPVTPAPVTGIAQRD